MVRELRDSNEWNLALLNEIARIATALEEIQCNQEFELQYKEARLRVERDLKLRDFK